MVIFFIVILYQKASQLSTPETSPDWQLPEPQPLQTAKSYKSKAEPIIQRWKKLVTKVLGNYVWALGRIADLNFRLKQAESRLEPLKRENLELQRENYEQKKQLKQVQRRYDRIGKFLGEDAMDEILRRDNRRMKSRGGRDLGR